MSTSYFYIQSPPEAWLKKKRCRIQSGNVGGPGTCSWWNGEKSIYIITVGAVGIFFISLNSNNWWRGQHVDGEASFNRLLITAFFLIVSYLEIWHLHVLEHLLCSMLILMIQRFIRYDLHWKTDSPLATTQRLPSLHVNSTLNSWYVGVTDRTITVFYSLAAILTSAFPVRMRYSRRECQQFMRDI